MAFFSIPATFVLEDAQRLADQNKRLAIPVGEVYGSLKGGEFGSGRSACEIPRVSFENLAEYVAECKRNGIQFNYTLNFACNGNREVTREGRDEILAFARQLLGIGIQHVTVALPTAMLVLEKFLPELKVSVSVISGVDSSFSLNQYLPLGNVERVCVREYMNRNIPLLRALCLEAKARGCGISTIINTNCLIGCHNYTFHCNFTSHSTGSPHEYLVRDFYAAQCSLTKFAHREEFLKMPWIRPEDLQTYVDAGVDVFKVQGRQMRGPDFGRVVDIYNQGHYDGDLVDLITCFTDNAYSDVFSIPNVELDEFMRGMLSRNNVTHGVNCPSCGYCERNSDLVTVSDEARAKWEGVFNERWDSLVK